MSNPKEKFSIYSLSNTLSKINEDKAMGSKTSGFYMLCDGMGGNGRGDLASEIATGLIEQFSHSQPLETDATWPFEKKDNLSLEENYVRMLLLKINEKVVERAQHENKMGWMGCSSIVLMKLDEIVVAAGIGNCKSYLFRKNQLMHFTESRSLATHKRWMPLKSEHNIALNFLGKDSHVEIDSAAQKTHKKGDLFILLSSGITHVLSEDEISDEIYKYSNNINALSKALVTAAHQKGSQFDATALVLVI